MESKLVLNVKTRDIMVTNTPTGTSQINTCSGTHLEIVGGIPAYINELIQKHNLSTEAHQTLWYTHEQGVASDIWEIRHNLNRRPSVTVVDTANNVVVGFVQYIDDNNVIVTFNGAFKGKAYLS